MIFYKEIVLNTFLTCLFLIIYINNIYLIYGTFAYPDTTLNFENVVGRIF